MKQPPALDSGLACLVMLARFLERPVDATQLQHHFDRKSRQFDETDLLRAAKHLDLKARAVNADMKRLQKTPLPAMFCDSEGKWHILARLSDEKALIQTPGKPPRTIPTADLEKHWNGRLILMTSRKSIIGGMRRFDISWFIPAIVRYRRLFAEVLVASFFLQLFALISPLLFQVIIDKVLVHRGLSTLDVLIFALITVSLFEVILGALRTYLFSHTTTRVDVELGTHLFRHLSSLPLAYFGTRRVGDTVARVRELENIRNFITGSALTLVIDLIFTFVFFAVMLAYSVTLTCVVAASIPFYAVLTILITPVLRKGIEEKFQRGAENQAFLVESITGVETVKSLSVEPQMRRRWEEQLASYVTSSFKVTHLSNIGRQGVQMIQKVTYALTLWFGAHLVMDNALTIGQLVAFNILAGRVSGPILRLAQLWQDFQQARISIDRLGDILNSPTEPTIAAGKASMPPLNGLVEFEKITFRYREDTQPVLNEISLSVKPGEVIGIVGPSGSGKSTLTKLIQRLYVPERGRVTIDGTDLSMVDPAHLRRQIGVVLQENFLFNRNVRDNIALADNSRSMDAIIQAAKIAGAHEFIQELPEGYETMIGERGDSLSGGQRQRIAIARALLTDPRILIFDEATSALDYESERAIQDNMAKICKGRTVFIIAHRLSTVRHCDRIITVEKGKIVEEGSHDTLIKKGGSYAHLWRCQTDDAVREAKEG